MNNIIYYENYDKNNQLLSAISTSIASCLRARTTTSIINNVLLITTTKQKNATTKTKQLNEERRSYTFI